MKKVFHLWFGFRGRICSKQFWLLGIAPGLLLGSYLLRMDAELDLQGRLFLAFLLFSIWPAAALTAKCFRGFRAGCGIHYP